MSVSKALGRNFSRLSSKVCIQAEPIGRKAHIRAVIKGSVGPNFGLRQVGNLLSANFHLLALLSVLSFNLRDFFFLIQICRVAKIFAFTVEKTFALWDYFLNTLSPSFQQSAFLWSCSYSANDLEAFKYKHSISLSLKSSKACLKYFLVRLSKWTNFSTMWCHIKYFKRTLYFYFCNGVSLSFRAYTLCSPGLKSMRVSFARILEATK